MDDGSVDDFDANLDYSLNSDHPNASSSHAGGAVSSRGVSTAFIDHLARLFELATEDRQSLLGLAEILKADGHITSHQAMAQLHQNATALSTNSKLRILVANMPELENVKAMHTDIKERLQSGWQPTDTQIVLLKKLIKGMLVEPNRLTFKGLSREIEAHLKDHPEVCNAEAIYAGDSPHLLSHQKAFKKVIVRFTANLVYAFQLDVYNSIGKNPKSFSAFACAIADEYLPGGIPADGKLDPAFGKKLLLIRQFARDNPSKRDAAPTPVVSPGPATSNASSDSAAIPAASNNDSDNEDDDDDDAENTPVASSPSERPAKRKRVEPTPPVETEGPMSVPTARFFLDYKGTVRAAPAVPAVTAFWNLFSYVIDCTRVKIGKKMTSSRWTALFQDIQARDMAHVHDSNPLPLGFTPQLAAAQPRTPFTSIAPGQVPSTPQSANAQPAVAQVQAGSTQTGATGYAAFL